MSTRDLVSRYLLSCFFGLFSRIAQLIALLLWEFIIPFVRRASEANRVQVFLDWSAYYVRIIFHIFIG